MNKYKDKYENELNNLKNKIDVINTEMENDKKIKENKFLETKNYYKNEIEVLNNNINNINVDKQNEKN